MLSGIDFPAIRVQRDMTAAKLEQLRSELLKLGHGTLLEAKRNELTAAKNAVETENNRNTSHRQSQMIPVEDRRPALQAAVDKAVTEAARWRRMAAGEEHAMHDYETKIQSCRDSWAAEKAKTFQAGNCPTCGQTLPETAQRAAQERFEADKKKAMQSAVERADEAKAALAAARSRCEEYIQAATDAETEADSLRAELSAYQPVAQPEIMDLPGHAERMAAAQEQVRILTAEVEKLESESTAIRAEITAKINALQSEVIPMPARGTARQSIMPGAW